MKKLPLEINDIRDDILSPGRILWKQRSGAEVVISAKGGFLNIEMITKLSAAGHTLLIEGDDETQIHALFMETFQSMEAELQLKAKLVYYKKFGQLLHQFYISQDRNQDDLSQLAWKLFSKVERNEARSFLHRDINFFKRAMAVASAYTFCAFFMGHYDAAFLRNIYTATFNNMMKLGSNQLINVMKNRLEDIRRKPHLTDEDRAYVKTIADPENIGQLMLLEKFDGSGVLNIKTDDMNDLELILGSFNYIFHWNEDYEGKNILKDIYEGRIKINGKVVMLIQKNLDLFKHANKEYVA